jgi:glycine cleavage system H lipoate-binding protein
MVVLFVILSIVTMVTIDYLIQRKKKIGLAAKPTAASTALSRVFKMLPEGVFLQPTFTWSKILDSGNLLLGIHPVLLGIIGDLDEIELLPKDEGIKKGESFVRLRKDKKVVCVKSPVKGKITAINSTVVEHPTWENLSQNWIYCIQPADVASQIKNWFIAGAAREWMEKKYAQFKRFFVNALPQTDLGITMADGGDIPVGILSHFDAATWKNFEKEFILKKGSSDSQDRLQLSQNSTLFIEE